MQSELSDAAASEALVAEVAMQAYAHGYTFLPQVQRKHGAHQRPAELMPQRAGEDDEERQLEESNGVERGPGSLGSIRGEAVVHVPHFPFGGIGR